MKVEIDADVLAELVRRVEQLEVWEFGHECDHEYHEHIVSCCDESVNICGTESGGTDYCSCPVPVRCVVCRDLQDMECPDCGDD